MRRGCSAAQSNRDLGFAGASSELVGVDLIRAELVEPLIGASSGRTRVVTSHDPAGGLAEADLALGLRAGRPELLAPAKQLGPDDVGALYG